VDVFTLCALSELVLPTAGYKITYSIATFSYDNCYANLQDFIYIYIYIYIY
jgi:hypothetical protein